MDYQAFRARLLNLVVPVWRRIAPAVLTSLMCPFALAADEQYFDFEIDAPTLSAAVLEFSRQTGIQMIVAGRVLNGLDAPAVNGSYVAAEALRRLLADTELTFEFVDEVTVVILTPAQLRADAPTNEPPQTLSNIGLEAPADAPGAERITEDILVTGTRVPRSELSAAIPITVVDIEDIEIGAIETLDGLLQQLPSIQQVTGARESQAGTERSGVASVALRGLGVERTLTLLDGKRIVSSRTGRSSVDLSTIPIDFIERIEVITGGASAIYGSDAMAGVINIITKKEFDGVHLRARGELPEAGGEENHTVSLTLGAPFADGRGHAMVAASLFNREPLFSRERPWSQQAIRVRNDGTVGPDFSSFTVGGLYNLIDQNGDRVGSSSTGRLVLTDGVSAIRPFDREIHGYNTNELATITTPIRRLSFASKFDYEITDATTLALNAYYTRTDTISNRSPESIEAREFFLGSDFSAFVLPIDHPFVPQSILDIANTEFPGQVIGLDWRRRLTELDRFIENTRETFRFGVALEGELNDSWDWNVGLNYGRTLQAQLIAGNTVKENVVDALDIEPDPTEPGSFRCVDPQAVLRGCVPLNFFGESSISAAAAGWISDRSNLLGTIEQLTLSGYLAGDLAELPAGKLSVAVGAEYREDDSRTTTDSLLRDQGTTFVAIPNNSGQTDVAEVFAEAVVPLIADQPLVEYLGIDAAVRVADYSHIGSVVSYKGGFEYAPLQSLRFRGGWSRATRAPSIVEAFSVPRTTGFSLGNDPCDGIDALAVGTIADNCRSIPAIAAEIAANGVFLQDTELDGQSFSLGNPLLFEENADTITLGAVYEPEFLPGLGLSVDWWDIDISDAIVFTDRQRSTDTCYRSVSLSSPECNLVFRDGNGQVSRVDSMPRNESGFVTSGIDVYANYIWDLSWGSIDFEMNWTHLLEKDVLRIIDPDTGEIDIDDDRGEVENPTNRVQLQASYNNGSWRVSWLTNFIGRVNTGNLALAEALADGEQPDRLAFRTIGSHSISKLNGSYVFGNDNQFQVFAGINNIFDRAPPVIPNDIDDEVDRESACVSNCSQYDPVGRSYFIGFNMRL